MSEVHDTISFGPHLLGRIPSPPDERDWQLDHFVGTDADLVAKAEAEFFQTTVGYLNPHWAKPPATTHWAKGLAYLAQIGGAPAPPAGTDKVWDAPEAPLNQLNYGTCVGNGCSQFLNVLPVDDKYTEGFGTSALHGAPTARAVYYEATVNDGQPDDPDAQGGGQQGASVRSGVKALKARGRVGSYASTVSLETMKTWLSTKGSLIVGTDWTEDMFTPDAHGYIKPTGAFAGGHCWLIRGVLYSESAFLARNSWGPEWGLAGDFKISWSDFQTLLTGIQYPGEVWTAVELP